MALPTDVLVGVIGGSGMYDMQLDDMQSFAISTPFGDPVRFFPRRATLTLR